MSDPDSQPNEEDSNSKGRAERRKIPGNLPYTTTPGVFRRVLAKIPSSEKPSVFNMDFLGTVLETTGGSARPVITLMKATGLISASGVPTDLYAQFQTESGRASAALQALRNGFSEVFRRNQFAHKADEKTVLDLIVAVTGLPRTDGIVRNILNTFQVFQEYAREAREDVAPSQIDIVDRTPSPRSNGTEALTQTANTLGLVYNINIVLPETTNVEVYNAIFKSLRGNLLS
jgi:hypothetical protein